MSHRGKIHETCRYWKESKCLKGEYQCSFIHGYVCGNDGRCWRDNCNRIHFNQKKPLNPRDFHPNKQNFHKQGYRPRERRSHSGSPDWYHKSLPRGRSPIRRRSRSRSRTPPHHLVRGCSPPRRHTSRSLSPRRFSRSRSPSRRQIMTRGRSWRRSRSRSRGRSVTPYRSRSRSPRARSRSPSIPPPQIRSRSSSSSRPQKRSRSASRSYSRARSRSSSRLHPPPRSTSVSPVRKQTRSISRSRTRSPSRPGSRGGRRSRPHSRSGSTARSLAGKRHSSYSSRSKSSSPERNRKTSRSPAHQAKTSTVASKKIINLEDLYADIDNEEPSQTADQLSQNDAAAVSKIQAQLSKTFFDPETKKLIEEALKSTRENQSRKEREEQNSEDENEDRLGLDLEEVGEEVDDIFTKSMTRSVDDSGENNFQTNMQGKRRKEMEAGSNPSPPKPQPGSKSPVQPLRTLDLGFHTDWELKSALDNPSQPLEKEIKMPMAPPPIITGGGRGKPSSSSLWTPALDRRMVQEAKIKTQMAYQDKGSNWEVETPYVGRKEKCELKDVVSTKPIHRSTERKTEEESTSVKESTLFPSAMSHSLHVSSSASGFGSADRSNFMDFRSKEKERLPSRSPEPVSRLSRIVPEDHSPRASSESPRRHQKEKKKKRKKESSNSESESSDGEERRDEQRVSQEKEELRRGIDTLLTRKESLTKRVKLLLEQKNMMNDQRHDIMKNHKGSRAALTNLLDENSFLIKEIGKQISNIHNMIEKVEEDIDVKQEVLRKVSKPVFSDKPDSPHQSKERQRKLLYSPEREKYRKASYYNQVNEGKSSPVREDRSRPGYRKESPPAGYNKQYRFTEGPSEPTSKRSRMLQQGDEKWSRSPSGQRLPPGISKESGGRHLASSPDSRGSTSPPSKVRVAVKVEKERLKDGEEGRGQYTSKVSQKSYSRHMEQEGGRKETETEPSARMLYAPHESQRTFMRYMDQGMHWCKLCATFCETAPEYIDHLMSQSHLDRVKNDRKSWLAKAPREEKEQRPPNAQVITVPLQGLEFIHSLPSYYCSLCDTFMRDKGEAVRHPESKLHVSNYKVHRAKNPLLETTFLKAKTAAYAKYKIDEERKLMEDQIKAKDKTKMEIESKLLRQVHEKLDRRDDRREDRKEDRVEGKAKDKNEVCGSIRVASRGQRQRKSYHRSAPSEKKDYRDTKEVEKSPRDLKKETSPPRNSNIAKKMDRAKDKEDNSEPSKGSPVAESKPEASTKENNVDSKKKEEDKKSSTTKLPLIGKMPFLKKRPSLMKKKDQEQKKADVAKEVTEQKTSKAQAMANSIDGNVNPLPVIENKVGNSEEKERNSKDNASVEQTSDSVDPKKEESHAGNVETFEGERYVVMTFSSHDEDSSDSDIMDISETYLVDEEKKDEYLGAAEETIQALDLLNIPLPGFEPSSQDQKSISEELPPPVDTAPQSGEELSASQPSGIEKTLEVSASKDLIVLPSPPKSIEYIPLPPGTEEEVSKKGCSYEPIPPGTEASLECPMDVDLNYCTPLYPNYVMTTSKSYVDGAAQEGNCAEPAVFSCSEGNHDIPLPPGMDKSHVKVTSSSSPLSSNVTGDFVDDPVPQLLSCESYGSDNNGSEINPSQQDGGIMQYFVIEDPKPIPVLGAVQYNWKPPPIRRVEREPTPPPPGTETYISHPILESQPTVHEELTPHKRQGRNVPFSKGVHKDKDEAPQSLGSKIQTKKIPSVLSSKDAPAMSDNTDKAESTIGGDSTKEITSEAPRTPDVQPCSPVKELTEDKVPNDPVSIPCRSEEKDEKNRVESTSDKEGRTNDNSALNTKSGKEEGSAVEISSCLESKQEEETSSFNSKSDEGECSVTRIGSKMLIDNVEEESTTEGKSIKLINEEEEESILKESSVKSVCETEEVEEENEEVFSILNETGEKDETKYTSEDRGEISEAKAGISEAKADISEDRLEISEDKAEIIEDKLEVSEDKLEISEDKLEMSEDILEISEEHECVESETEQNIKTVTDEEQDGIEETVSIHSVSEEKEDRTTEEHSDIIEERTEEPDDIKSFTEEERNITDSASCVEFISEDESIRNEVMSSTESEEEKDSVEARSCVEFVVGGDKKEVGSIASSNKEEEDSFGDESSSVKAIPEEEGEGIDSPPEYIEYKTKESNDENSFNEERKDVGQHEPQFDKDDDDDSDDDKSMGESLKTSLQEICRAVDDLIDSPAESTPVNSVKSSGGEQEEPPQGLFATQCLLLPGALDDANKCSNLSEGMVFGVGNSSSALKIEDEARKENVINMEEESEEVIGEPSPESNLEASPSSCSDSGVAPQRTDSSEGERGEIYLQDSQLHSTSTEDHLTTSTTSVQNLNQESQPDQLSPQNLEKNLLESGQEEEDLLSTQMGMCDVPSAGICDIEATLNETELNLGDVITDDTESHTSKPGSCSDEVSTGNIEDYLDGDDSPPKRVTRPTGKRTQRGRKRPRRSSRSSTVKEVEEVDLDDIPEEAEETRVLSSEDLSRDSLTQSSDTADMTLYLEETQPVTKQTARGKRAAARQRAEEEESFVSSRKRSRSSSSSSSRRTSEQTASVQELARPIRSSRRAAVAASAAMSAMARSSDLSPTSSPPIEKDKEGDSVSGEESESE